MTILFRELKFWVQSALVCTLPLVFIYYLAGYLGFPNPVEPISSTSHADPGHASLGFILLAIVFYTMRSIDRVAYGFAELLFAFSGFGLYYENIVSNYTYQKFLLTTGGFVYVAVRGIDNVVTGAKKHYANPASDPHWFW